MFSATDANFTGISDVTGLYLMEVIQKAYIEVDEEGTEATAATGLQKQLISTISNPFLVQTGD